MNYSLDLGRSNLRALIEDKLFIYSSKYKEVKSDAIVRADGDNHSGDFIIERCPWAPIVGKRFVKGDTANYHNGIDVSANSQDLKTYQDETYINVAYLIASRIVEDKGALDFNEVVNLGICIPAREFFSTGMELIKKNLNGAWQISFPILKKTVIFQIKDGNVTVAPEGGAAYVYAKKGKHKEVLNNSTTMILDAGHGSFDVLICVNGKPKGLSSESARMGGETLEVYVATALEDVRIAASDTNIRTAIDSGYVMKGNVETPVGTLVQECKERLAKLFIQPMMRSLAKATMSDSEINNFMPIGRCFKVGGEKGTEYYTGDIIEIMLSEKLWKYEVGVIKLEGEKRKAENTKEEVDILEIANVEGVYTRFKKAI